MKTEVFMKYYKRTDEYEYANPNPTAAQKHTMVWDKCDCCIRALALATGTEWIEAFDFLTAKARRDFSVPNDGKLVRQWLCENGGVWTACKAVKGKARMTVQEFAKTHKDGRYIIKIANHECACVNGVVKDTWNPAESAVFGYVDMSNFKF